MQIGVIKTILSGCQRKTSKIDDDTLIAECLQRSIKSDIFSMKLLNTYKNYLAYIEEYDE